MFLQGRDDIEIEPAPPQAAAALTETKRVLQVPNIDQEQDTWCYAACAEMVFSYYQTETDNRPIRQCDVVRSIRNGADCCGAQPDDACINTGCQPEEIVTIYNNFGLSATSRQGQLSFDEVKIEINRGSPVEVCIQWGDPNNTGLFSAHVVIIKGWIQSSVGRFLRILDPLRTGGFGGRVSFEQLQLGFSQGTWKFTFGGFPNQP